MQKEFLNITEAAEFLGVSLNTLRRWDNAGKLKAERKGERGHRFYKRENLELFKIDLFKLCRDWASDSKGWDLEKKFYCQNSAIFNARLNSLTEELKLRPDLRVLYSLIVSITGEIGNNSFDHNLGNWPDIIGIFFGYDINKREIVLADRGLGIFYTLKRVKTDLKNYKEALRVAFTEIISGRAPESRGNGLKLVRRIVAKYPINLSFQSGDYVLTIKKNSGELKIKKQSPFIRGCLAYINF